MARINIEDELRGDPRFTLLCTMVPRHIAFGVIICFWELGQSYWKRQKTLIPNELASLLPHIAELKSVGFAVERENGVYCSGAEDRWAFLLAKSEAGKAGGKASAQARKEKYGSSIPSNASNQNRSTAEADAEQNSEANRSKPKPSSSSSSSQVLKEPEEILSSAEEPSIHWLAELWNTLVPSLPRVKKTGDKRLDRIRKRVDERPLLSEWERIFEKVEASDFLSGRNGRWGACSFDWILSNHVSGTANHVRVDEGIHDNKSESIGHGNNSANRWLDEAEIMLKAVKKYSKYDSEQTEAWLGEPRWTWFLAIGRSRIGNMPDNEFSRRDLAKLIEAEARGSPAAAVVSA